MLVLIKLFYAAALAALLVLFVAFGVKTLSGGPEPPEFPQPPFVRGPIVGTPPTPTPREVEEYEEAQREYQREYEEFEDDRRGYHRNVFLLAAVVGVLAVSGGIALWSRLDAMSLGFVAGGLATLIYGIIQAEGDLDDIGPELVFLVAFVGLLLVLAAGYRWLARPNAPEG